jgi:hypothetical protein
MDETQLQEKFDTGLKKIREDIKGRLVLHGLFGTVTCVDSGPTGQVGDKPRIEIVAKGKTVARSFDRKQIEGCYLRVGGEVLVGIVAMVEELSA